MELFRVHTLPLLVMTSRPGPLARHSDGVAVPCFHDGFPRTSGGIIANVLARVDHIMHRWSEGR
jgi:hypothetical protein